MAKLYGGLRKGRRERRAEAWDALEAAYTVQGYSAAGAFGLVGLWGGAKGQTCTVKHRYE